MAPGDVGRIVLQRAAFGYRGRPVVSDVDLTVGPGDFIGVLGPNGSGKTTLFRGILGLLPALSGKVLRESVRPGYVPQRDTLDPVFPLTVQEVVAMGAAGSMDALGRLRPEDRERVGKLLEAVELGDKRKASFAALSGGQRQRVLLARALLPRPNVLLLDEPTSGVDMPTQERVLALLKRLNEEEQLAILLVSHHLASTRAAVRSVVWVDGGRATLLEGPDALEPARLDALFMPSAAVDEAPAPERA